MRSSVFCFLAQLDANEPYLRVCDHSPKKIGPSDANPSRR